MLENEQFQTRSIKHQSVSCTPQPSVDELRRIDQEYLCWGDTVHYQERPIIVSTCQGGLIFDEQGNSYLDTGMWHSSCNFGYRNPQIEAAVIKQMTILPQANGDFLHKEKLLVAKEVVDAIYQRTGVKGRVSFNVSGSLVVEDALKIVRKNTGKNKVAVMMGAYHGRSLGALNLSSSHRYREYYNEFPEKSVMFPFANCSQCFYEKQRENCDLYCARMINKSFSNEYYGLASSNSSEVGAVVIEPCQGRGYTIPPQEFYRQFVDNLKKRNILIIDDEIQVGMYRTGKLFAFEHFDFVPDIITLSKSFTNGLSPVSLVWAREDLVNPEIFTPGHAHSNFGNHPLGTAAALASWRYMISQDYETSVPEKGRYFLQKLQELQRCYSFVYRVDGLGLLLNMFFADEHGKPYRNSAHLAAAIAQDNDFTLHNKTWRMVLQTGGYDLNVLKFAPHLDITYEEIDRMIGVLNLVLKKLESLLVNSKIIASSGKMKAVVLSQANHLKIRQVPIPNPTKMGELLADVRFVGVCKTDQQLMEKGLEKDCILGHEIVCCLPDEKGHFCLNNEISCGECSYCLEGLTSHCLNLKELGVNEDGGYAEKICVPQKALHSFQLANPALGVLIEPLSCAVHGFKRILSSQKLLPVIQPKTLVIGGGISGTLMTYLLDKSSEFKGEIFLYDITPNPLPCLDQLGLERLEDPEPDHSHLIIECSGSTAGLSMACNLVRKGGLVCIYGVPKHDISLPVSPHELLMREITLLTSFAGATDETMTAAIEYIQKDEAFFAQLLGKFISLEQLSQELTYWSPQAGTRTVVDLEA